MAFFKKSLPSESWINPKAKRGLTSKIHGMGLFAVQPISKNEVIVAKAGHIIDRETLQASAKTIKGSEAQITEDLFVAPLTDKEFEGSMAYCNHSCEPNAGFGGNILVVAMRNISPGEEIDIDYATMWSDPTLVIEQCNCQQSSCRHRITGDDWKNPGLQKKYEGYFSWYLQQKIKAQG